MQATTDIVNSFVSTGIAGTILFIMVWFVIGRLWPWLTEVYWPTKQKQQDKMSELLEGIKDSLTALRIIQERQDDSLEKIGTKVDRVENEQIKINHQLAVITAREAVREIERPQYSS